MRTPKEYSQNLNKGIITDRMLEGALFSVNKRAKNWRDQKRKFRDKMDYFNNEQRASQEEQKMYRKKEELLGLLTPICIHKEFGGYKHSRVYEYDPDFNAKFLREIYHGTVVWHKSNYRADDDYDYLEDYDSYSCGTHRSSCFEYEDRTQPIFRYYLFYIIGDHSFHIPMAAEAVAAMDLPCFMIDTLRTTGHDTDDLLSMQFVDKLLSVVHTGNFKLASKTTSIEYVRKKRQEERGRQITEEQIRAIPEDVRRMRISDNWRSITSMMKDYLLHDKDINSEKAILSEKQKTDLELQTKASILEHLRSAQKSHRNINRPVKSSGYMHFYNEESLHSISAAGRFLQESADYFTEETDVTIENLCALYLDLYPASVSDFLQTYAQKKAEIDFIRKNETRWENQVRSALMGTATFNTVLA